MASTDATTVATKMMKAVVWKGDPYHVCVEDVPRPTIEAPSDIIIRTIVAGICGSVC